MVVPAKAIFVDQAPDKAQTHKGPGQYGGRETQASPMPVDLATVRVAELDFPGAQAKGLAAVGPEPTIEQVAYAEQVEREIVLAGGKGLT